MTRLQKVYDMWKGETYIDSGTAQELAQKYHVKKETMQWYASNVNRRRNKGNRIMLFPTGEYKK